MFSAITEIVAMILGLTLDISKYCVSLATATVLCSQLCVHQNSCSGIPELDFWCLLKWMHHAQEVLEERDLLF